MYVFCALLAVLAKLLPFILCQEMQFRDFGGQNGISVTAFMRGGSLTIYSKGGDQSLVRKAIISLYKIQEINDLGLVTAEYNPDLLSAITYSIDFPEDVPIPRSFNNTPSTRITMVGQIKTPNVGGIEVSVYITKSAGVCSMDNEIITMSAGAVKIITHLTAFNLAKETEYLQVIYSVQVSVGGNNWDNYVRGASVENFPVVFDAISARIQTSRKVLVDNSFLAAPAGYPTNVVTNGTNFLQYRLPKFSTEAAFDTTVELILKDYSPYTFACIALRSHSASNMQLWILLPSIAVQLAIAIHISQT